MERPVSLRLGHFPVEVLAEADGGADNLQRAFRRAIRLYLNDAGADRPGWAYPDFLRDKKETGEVGVELSIDEVLWIAFEDEAERQGISPSRLASHAALYYAAEFEAGHIPRRILEETEDGELGEAQAEG
jgi:hypothetical protein